VERLPVLSQQLNGGTSGNSSYSCVEKLQVLYQQLCGRNIIRYIVEFEERSKKIKVKLTGRGGL
jgi:hypothetical protein